MHAENDNDTRFQQNALSDAFDSYAEALLGALYAGDLMRLRRQVEGDCRAQGCAFETLETVYASEDEGPNRAYVEKIFHGDADKVENFEVYCEFRNDARNFWHAIADSYLAPGNKAALQDIETQRAILTEDLQEFGGIGRHEARALIGRVEGTIHKAIGSTIPFIGRQV